METITIMEGNSRVNKTPVKNELFTEILEDINEKTPVYYGTFTPEQLQQGVNLSLNQIETTPEKKESFLDKYKVPIILGGSLVVIGLLYWLFFMRKK